MVDAVAHRSAAFADAFPGEDGPTVDQVTRALADDHFVFVVPSLRNVAETGPWFHDGYVETLEEAVRLMARHQLGRVFTDDESAALVAILHTLTADEIPAWAYPP
jgi:cytochrome c peroxidase